MSRLDLYVRSISAALLAICVCDAGAAGTAADYARAERFLPWNQDKYLRNAEIQPHWLPGENRFCYSRTNSEGAQQFVVVDMATGQRRVGGDATACANDAAPASDGTSVLSPDRQWAAFLKDHNLWVRATDGSAEYALTSDGETDNGYAISPGNNVLADALHRARLAPVLLWSPDSKRILTHRLDERQVEQLHVLEMAPRDGTFRPKLSSRRYAMANDARKAVLTQMVFHVAARRRIDLEFLPMPVVFQAPIESEHAWWSADSARVYYVERGPYYRTLSLEVADAASGTARTLIEESGATFIELSGVARKPMVSVLAGGEVIWFSEREGWGHLYRYDGKTGRLKNQITRGPWVVREIVRIDERARRIYFLASGRETGRNPYLRHLYRISFDGSGAQLLTPENADHATAFDPSGRYFVDVHSRPDLPPVSVLRASDGRLIAQLETADVTRLQQEGFAMPELFEAVAADGKTPIYGVILRPSNFDPGLKYPVIDSVYPGPQVTRAQHSFAATVFDSQGAAALAELGFVVVTLDGRGTPLRSKAFLNDSYGRLGAAGNLADHVAVIRQLAQRHPWMSLQQVGVSGYSGGGFAALRAMLDYPEFYKVGVAASGNHDQRGYLAVWGETYNGPDDGKNYLAAANAPLAANLRGKLLLMHGGADDNVHPALTMQVAQALIEANRDFELLVVPKAGHDLFSHAYPIRRQWDFFVRHLMGAEPPEQYNIAPH
jgi:dipeptidyl-peptidase 4